MATVSQPLTGSWRQTTATKGLWSWIATVDHKRIGILYFFTGFFFFAVGGIEALLMRLQLAKPEANIIGAELFNQLFTMHGITMVFLAVMPLIAAFANFLLPLMIGARDVAYPRLNAFSYWNFLFGGIFLNTSWLMKAAPDVGWFGYTPLSAGSSGLAHRLSGDFYTIGLILLGIGTLVSAFNFIVTILNMRAPGMTLFRMPVFVWTILVISILIIFSFPPVTVSLIMLLFDRMVGTNFFNVAAGGNQLLWQHLFWTFGHPEVYILILPAFGIVSEILPTFARKPLFGYSIVVFSSLMIGFMGFAVWSHHMFTVGMGPVVNTIFSLTTMAIAIPTGVKIFNWLATLWGGRLRFTTPMMFVTAFLITFTIGGMSGVMHSSAPSNAQQQDTYFIVAHFHYVLVGGALMALMAATYYWFPKMFGRLMNERLGKINFWLTVIGFNVLFFPFHFLGLMGMPRRIYTYHADLGEPVALWNLVSTIGAFILAAGFLVFFYNVAVSLRSGEKAPADPWDARTIEWSLPSPVPVYNYASIPLVRARDAFWAHKYEGIPLEPVEKKSGKHPIHLPAPSIMPFILALGLTVMGYGGIIVQASGTGAGLPVVLLGLAVSLVGLYGWVFEGEGAIYVEPEEDR